MPTNQLFAQEQIAAKPVNQYRAVHLGLDEGLTRERWHMAIIKDKNGFMWFGSSNGELARFDGNQFKQYYNYHNIPGTNNSNACFNFIEDSLNNVWIGHRKGLTRYDIRADSFTNIFSAEDKSGLNISCIPFFATSNEIFCVENGKSISSVNIYTLVRKEISRISQEENTLLNPLLVSSSVYDSISNSFWLLRSNEEALTQISLSTGTTKVHKRTVFNPKPDGHGHVDAEAMCFDQKRHCLWINSHDGLFKFDLNDFSFHSVASLQNIFTAPGYFRSVGISLDKFGRIWFSTMPKGIVIYDPTTDIVSQPINEPEQEKLISLGNLKIYCDRDGITWTSYWTMNGIFQLIPYSPSVRRYNAVPSNPDSLSSANITHALPGNNGLLWVGSDDGLNIFDPVKGRFSVRREKQIPGLKGKAIVPMYIDTIRKKAWVNASPPDRVYEIDVETMTARNVEFLDMNNKVIEPVNIIGYLSDSFINGFLFYDAGRGIFEVSGKDEVARLVIPFTGMIPRMHVFNDNLLFIFTPGFNTNRTYAYLKDNWTRINHPMDSIAWTDLFFDKKDRTYWAGLAGNLVHFTNDFKEIRRYTTENESSGYHFFSIQKDDQGNIWFTNNMREILVLNPTTGLTTTLSAQDGFHKQPFDFFSYINTSVNGELYFAGNFLSSATTGLDRVNPTLFNYPPSEVYIESIQVNKNPLKLSEGSNELKEIYLAHDQNQIFIKTGIIDYYSGGKSHMRYKLDGSNEQWQYADYYTTIRFDELMHGDHVLEMQASNAGNQFTGPVKKLIIHISPAFWNTWWFRLLAILVIGGIFYGLIRWWLQDKFNLRLERIEKEKQISDIKHKAAEMEMQALRAQMNPHFIFNSLNSINRFILQNNKAKASEYLTKFSKLVRLILQNSQASLITLESELESLSLYLDLEALRFDYRFDYKISVPKDLDISSMKVPPLIIQPYAENAIWHGLMHKESRGNLDIDISQENEHLYLTITDDGIGRKQSANNSSKSATRHKSMGLKITEERIKLMEMNNGVITPVQINDLVHADGTAAGTEVILTMPVIYD